MTRDQQNVLNAACEDLAEQIDWHGHRLSKDDWRHLISGTVLGWRNVPGVDMDGHGGGMILLGGSSLLMSVQQATLAIDLAFWIGDEPSSQKLQCEPVRWGPAICKARWLVRE